MQHFAVRADDSRPYMGDLGFEQSGQAADFNRFS